VPFVAPDGVFEGTREAWLQKIVETWRPYFQRLGYRLPSRIWVSVGRPPSSRSTGVCYPPEASDDANPHIFIHPVLSDSTRVAGTVVHQLCHAALGNRWHGQHFKKLATAVGLVGRMTRTIEGPLFLQVIRGSSTDTVLSRIRRYASCATSRKRAAPASFGSPAPNAVIGCAVRSAG
jgi:hypothetical protein